MIFEIFTICHCFLDFSCVSRFFKIFHDFHEGVGGPRKEKTNQSSKKHGKTSQQHVPAGPSGPARRTPFSGQLAPPTGANSVAKGVAASRGGGQLAVQQP